MTKQEYAVRKEDLQKELAMRESSHERAKLRNNKDDMLHSSIHIAKVLKQLQKLQDEYTYYLKNND